MQVRSYQGFTPQIGENCYIDTSSVVIGRVKIGKDTSIWCNSVIRGDVSSIEIGDNTNIQDLTMLHVTHYSPGISRESPLTIGNNVTVGHNCCLHACTVMDNVLVGMGSTLLDNCIIEPNILIGAGSLVPSNKRLESGYLYFGNPLKKIRPLTAEEIQFIQYSAEHYVRVKNGHLVASYNP
ncbi:MAG: gamma carbonic anhydrase family protein [Burkholderiales bacterium]|jgi:carbonic anhydrase/acetyltransferase-like protein (isoleucine patch superfamily)|nr:gamma carbonic anhydrase family protein [Burkholderiales bacterium]